MKSPTILVALFALCVLGATPASTEAASGYILNDTTAIFFLDFGFDAGDTDHEFSIPLVADHTVGYFDRVNSIGYQLTSATATTPSIAKVSDIVLSTATISDGTYKVTSDTKETFTLMSIVTFNGPIDSSITAAFTKIPYWLNGTRTTVHENQLNELATATATQL